MPRLSKSLPKYRKHKASGQAVVSFSGQDHYLGPHGTKTSKLEYDRLIAEWLANGRQALLDCESTAIKVSQLMARYWAFAKTYYVILQQRWYVRNSDWRQRKTYSDTPVLTSAKSTPNAT